jgi:hypothetical protein
MKTDTSASSHAILQSVVSENLNSGEYNSVIDAIPEITRLGSYAHLVPLVIKAALALNTSEAIESAAGLAIACDSNERQRAEHALLLASGGRTTDAFVVLFADPKIQWFPDHVQLMARAISIISRSMNTALPAARAAKRILRRIKEIQPRAEDTRELAVTLRTRSSYGFTPIIKALPQKLLGPPTKSYISDHSLEAYQEEFKRGLQQAEDKILSYKIPPIFELRNVFINRYGSVWMEDGTILKLVPGTGSVLPTLKSNIQHVDTLIPVGAIDITQNPYLWFARTLPALAWRWEMAGADIAIGISDEARPWVAESIIMASKEPPNIVSIGDAVFVKRLILADFRMHFLGRHEAYEACFERIFQRAEATGIVANTAPFYISRRDSKRRSMANELALEEALAARGVKPIVLTGLSFAEKVSLFRKAPLVVGPHGAGFGYLVFSEPVVPVVEILPIHTPFTHHRVNIPNLSRIMGHKHHHYLALPQKVNDDGSWELDIRKFLEFFDQHFG